MKHYNSHNYTGYLNKNEVDLEDLESRLFVNT